MSTSPDSVTLPNRWIPRPYQMAAWQALEQGCRRMVLVYHRRAGKDDICLHWTATQAIQYPANYWYMLPQANQARKAIWTAVDSHTGQKRIDWAFPPEIRESTNDQEMLIRFKNGSTWQVVGSDNYSGVIGSGAYGIVYSEYMLSDPNAWLYLAPILEENGGWAIFNGTPRGRNHLYGLYELGQHEPGWFSQRLTVKDTQALTDAQIETIRRTIAAERGDDEADNAIAQEYFCSWDAAIPGSYYGKMMAALEQAGSIDMVPYDPRWPVTTAWDIGVGDSTAIWFVQQTRTALKVIDYYEASGVGADHYAKIVREKGYSYERHILPHDANDREWGNNASSRVDVLRSLGLRPLTILPRASVDDGINAVRVLLHGAVFDRKRCERGIAALREYQKRWDDKLKVFSQAPLHDWTSHAADAFRYLAQGLRDAPRTAQYQRPEYSVMS
jgi:phage terminase large subunit